MSRLYCIGWALVAFLPAATPVSAQHVPELPRGARIRVVAPALGERPVVGTHDTATVEWLAYRPAHADTVARIPWAQLARLEVSAGRNTRRGRVVGALVGFGTMFAGGLLCLAICPTDPEDGANLAPAGGFIYGLIVGAPVGALLGGSRFAPERWRTIPVPKASER
jgi:hypothetical protein